MTELEKLNERIAQLTDLVKSGEETISATKEMLKLAEQERDRLADQRREQEPKFERVEYKKQYFGVRVNSEINYGVFTEIGDMVDNAHFRNNNYFYTEERAKEVTNKINLLLRLERLHDIYCPDYVPDWNNLNAFKYTIIYNIVDKSWYYNQTVTGVIGTCAYFPTREIAKKVCDILNAEERSKDV